MKTFFAIIGILCLVPVLWIVLPILLAGASVFMIAFGDIVVAIIIIWLIVKVIRKNKQ